MSGWERTERHLLRCSGYYWQASHSSCRHRRVQGLLLQDVCTPIMYADNFLQISAAANFYWTSSVFCDIYCCLVNVSGRETTTAIRQSSQHSMIGRKPQRTVWLHTRQRRTSQWRSWHRHTPSDLGWHSTSPCSTTRFWTRRTVPADWRRQRSTTRSLSWTRWARSRTRTQRSSCSCWETTSLCGRRTCRAKV